MPTDKQKENIERLLARGRKRTTRDRVYGFSEEDFTDHGGIDYLNDRELREISEKIKRGGYDKLS